ncbi:hypothetical protein [Micromonosporaceae bacterium CPCC 204380]|uniref:aromatic-ring hydroxylase C-terminal domain-containing protein n=1 Tax=Allorhizocola rhizosphaerae TaxID=1872709 RepID=UPI000E3D000C
MGPDGAVLIRPDGFITWLADGATPDAEHALNEALARSLSRYGGRTRYADHTYRVGSMPGKCRESVGWRAHRVVEFQSHT